MLSVFIILLSFVINMLSLVDGLQGLQAIIDGLHTVETHTVEAHTVEDRIVEAHTVETHTVDASTVEADAVQAHIVDARKYIICICIVFTIHFTTHPPQTKTKTNSFCCLGAYERR